MVAPPNTVTQLSHAMAIKAAGRTIGAINEWNPKINRTITELQEFGVVLTTYAERPGEPFEKVPGNVSGMQIEVRRYDIYTEQMEIAFGTPDITMLSAQTTAFDVQELWTRPSNTGRYFILYLGCWFSNIGRTITSTGDRVVNVNATLDYTHRRRESAS